MASTPVTRLLADEHDPSDVDSSAQGNSHSTDVEESFHTSFRSNEPHFTTRAILVGLAIGVLLCFCNVYFGLQTGWGNGMSIPASLLGFAFFKALPIALTRPFTPVENVLVQTVAGAAGTMPLGSGFTGIMPAIEFLLDPSEGAGIDLSLWRLLIWSLGLNLFGVVFAVPLRREVIVREKLKFPTGTATAVMIKVLHDTTGDRQAAVQTTEDDEAAHELLPDHNRQDLSHPMRNSDNEDQDILSKASISSKPSMRLLCQSFGVSGVYTLIAYFIPKIRNLPILGSYLASDWLWSLNPSPAYVGQGIIMGPATTSYMLVGAIFGWGVLSPLAKKSGWAPGEVDDWETGSRGWIVWVALAIMLTDALINLFWFIIKSTLRYTSLLMESSFTQKTLHRCQLNVPRSWRARSPAYTPIQSAAPSMLLSSHAAVSMAYPAYDKLGDAPPHQLVSNTSAFGMFFFSLLLCIVSMQISFGPIIAPQLSILAVLMAVILAIMGVRAVGETDINPASGIGKITQVIFALYTAGSSGSHRVLINLLAGQVADAGAGQAGDMMQDLKTGHLLGASPKAQFYGALIGSAFGALISPFIYRLYTTSYDLPSTTFPIPQAYVWVFAARLITGGKIPTMVGVFAVCTSILFVVLTVTRIYVTNHSSTNIRKWQPFIPSGIAVAIGMYNPPSFTLARAVGGAFSLWWTRHRGYDETTLTVLASGLVLGEGVVSIINLMLASFGAPHL